jgi:hypothetical protein
MAINYIDITIFFISRTSKICIPKFGFFGIKCTIWQPWSESVVYKKATQEVQDWIAEISLIAARLMNMSKYS